STIRESLPEDGEECFPTGDVEAMLAQLCEESARPGVSLDVLRSLDRARTQSELLRELLSELSEHVGRAVVMVIRDGEVSAWSGIGFPDGERLKGWHGEISVSPVFERFVGAPLPLSFTPQSDPLFSSWFEGVEFPEEAILLPISLRGKLMGFVYIDHRDDEPWDLDAAQALTTVACWLVDTLHHREEVPTPMLAEVVVFEPETADTGAFEVQPEPGFEEPFEEQEQTVEEPDIEPEVAAEPEMVAAPAAELPVEMEEPELEVEIEETVEVASYDPGEVDFEPPVAQTEPEFEIPTDETVPEEPEIVDIDHDFEEPAVEQEEPAYDPSATMRVEVGESLVSHEIPAPPPAPPVGPSTESAPPAAPTDSEIESMPPPVQPITPPPDMEKPAAAEEGAESSRSPEEEARHEEARRFARLLVSEIKLYNEDEVDRGRAAKDLHQRLKEDIDRSLEMYEKRIAPEIRAEHDYFSEELVRILGDGDPEALGM
ncbi:MAG: hypothetical protein P8Y93_12780, partial [Acidobacteriota bacterium]